MKSRTVQKILFSLVVSLLLSIGMTGISFGVPPIGEIAIKGYDTVAYFNAGKALKGDGSYTIQWRNMTWYFINKENRELFATAPEKYAPQYDGYCAWAMTEARKALTDPEVWKIVDGKLYLNCSRTAYEKWSSDIPGNIRKADMNWRRISVEQKGAGH